MILENQEFAPQDPLNEAFIQDEECPPHLSPIPSPHFSIQSVLFQCQDSQMAMEGITLDSTGMIQQMDETEEPPLKRQRPLVQEDEQEEGENELQAISPRWPKRSSKSSQISTIQTILELIQTKQTS